MLQIGLKRKLVKSRDYRGAVDRSCAVIALIPASAVLLITAIMTWALLGRPILFCQQRVGLHGVPFTIKKFRTMSDKRDESGRLLADELRTTFVTKFLRRIRIDELPQLFSIARGEMAIIGPRPLLPTTIHEMGTWGHVRCKVKPGLTGWSQVNGNTLLSDGQKLALDIWYVHHHSLRLDLLIIWKTLITVLWGERIDTQQLATAETYLRGLTQTHETEQRD